MSIFKNKSILKILSLWAFCLAASVHAAPESDLWSFWDASGDQVGIDHSGWQAVLDTYVVAADDDINRVRYGALENGQAQGLNDYIAYLASLDPRVYTADEQMAYWVNLYNALTIQVVLQYPNKKSILRMGERFLAIGPWDDEVVEIAGENVTLNDIEHRILRPIWNDHRIHFAVNCASIGCPNLSLQAFQAATLADQLDQAEIAYLEHPRGVNVDGDKVTLSSIFKWYRTDFGDTEEDVLEYIGKHHPTVQSLVDAKRRVKVRYDYDWALNAVNPR